jgi:hypothetical protein
MYAAYNIIYDCPVLQRLYYPANHTVIFDNNILANPWTGPGSGNQFADPMLNLGVIAGIAPTNVTVAQARQAAQLLSGSPAIGAGFGGLNLGCFQPHGMVISGAPVGATPATSATLTVGPSGTFNWGTIATQPWGWTAFKWKLDDGAWSSEIVVTNTSPFTNLAKIQLTGLAPGSHTVYVVGKNDAGYYQNDTFVYPPTAGISNRITASHTWIVDPNAKTLRINEVLASNRRAFDHFATSPDALELLNFGANPLDLGGVRLTDDPSVPGKYEFPAGASIGAGEYLVLLANNRDGTPGYHMGFNLNRQGQTLYVYDSVARGGALLDTVAYGPQVTDYSIGRLANGAWALNHPTLGEPNVEQQLGTPYGLKINEWLAAGEFNFFADFVELFNSQTLPVALGGLYLTDKPDGWPAQDQIAALSFIGPLGYTVFQASGKSANGPDNLNFSLSGDHGVIELLDGKQSCIDMVFYDYLRPDYSVGRSPNGGVAMYSFNQPTPGSGNPLIMAAGTNVYVTNIYTTNIYLTNIWVGSIVATNIVALGVESNLWAYDASGSDLQTQWRQPNYNDSAWTTGLPMFNRGAGSAFPVPINTTLSGSAVTTYFRTRVNPSGLWAGSNIVNYLAIQHYVDDGAIFYVNGQEIYRYNIPVGPIDYLNNGSSILVTNNSGNAPGVGVGVLATGWATGTNVLAVELHNSSSSSGDVTFWASMSLYQFDVRGYTTNMLYTNITSQQITVTNIIGGSAVINEVFANGDTFTNVSGTASDWVELYNPGDQAVSLAGLGLTDNSADPLRWVFPAGAQLAGRGYLVVAFDGNRPPSSNLVGVLNTGFSLKSSGGGVYLYDASSTLLNSVNYGVQIADYSIGRNLDGLGTFVLATPTPGSANIPTLLGSASALKINEWMPNDKNGGNDWFEIYNPSFLPVALDGLYLTDDLLNPVKSPMSPLSFIGGGTNGYLKFIADNNMAAGADHVRFKMDNLKESIGLGTSNAFIDTVSWNYTVSDPGVTEGRFPDGSTNIVTFPDTASPGEPNYRLLTNVIISEVLSASALPEEDAIELQNLSDQPVNIGGWYLSDAKNNLRKYRIPDGSVIAAHQFAVFYENQFNADPAFNPAAFALSSTKGDEVYLATATNGVLTGYRTSVSFGAALPGVSFGRYLTSDGREEFVSLARMTFGLTNQPGSVEDFRFGTGASNAYPLVGPVVIRQIMYHPPDLGTNDNVQDEFIELYNAGATAVPLYDPAHATNTWHIRGGVSFDIPAGLTLSTGTSLLVVSFDPVLDAAALNHFRTNYQLTSSALVVGPFSGKLNNSADSVELNQPGAPVVNTNTLEVTVPRVLVERVKYKDTSPWPVAADGSGQCLQRVANLQFGNDPVNWVAAPPSFGTGGNLNLDSDGDGIPDAWVQQYFGHASGLVGDLSRAADDADGDGMNNLQEYLAGTSPVNPASVLKILSVSPPAGASAPITFLAVSNHAYTVEFKAALDTNAWSVLQTYPAAPTNRLIQVPVPASGRSGFLRLRTP